MKKKAQFLTNKLINYVLQIVEIIGKKETNNILMVVVGVL